MSDRVVVIVQARLGSSRLPGKVLADLNGKTVLRRVLERCISISGIDAVCCAVPVGKRDEGVAQEAERSGAVVTRGSELDVLNRYYEAACQLGAGYIMRVTSDCPLFDPDLGARVLDLLTESGADYTCNNLPASWPHGLDCEAFTFDWLARAEREARLPSEREHVTPFIRLHPDAAKLVLHGPGDPIAQHRWTLDTEDDLRFLRALFARMPEEPLSYSYRFPLSILEREPTLARKR